MGFPCGTPSTWKFSWGYDASLVRIFFPNASVGEEDDISSCCNSINPALTHSFTYSSHICEGLRSTWHCALNHGNPSKQGSCNPCSPYAQSLVKWGDKHCKADTSKCAEYKGVTRKGPEGLGVRPWLCVTWIISLSGWVNTVMGCLPGCCSLWEFYLLGDTRACSQLRALESFTKVSLLCPSWGPCHRITL